VQVPSKAILFGEYGLFEGMGAVVFVSTHHFFFLRMEVRLKSGSQGASCWVQSDFFPSGELDLSAELQALASNPHDFSSPLSRDQKFFLSLLFPYLNEIKNCEIKIFVLRSYDPRLGLGSSSALMAAVHFLLDVYLMKAGFVANETSYERILQSLKFQGSTGSGYDALVQHKAANCMQPSLFWVTADPTARTATATALPHVLTQWVKSLKGTQSVLSVVDSGVYSDTQKVLQGQSERGFFKRHGDLALRWKNADFDLNLLPDLMKASVRIAEAQGLMGNDDYLRTFQKVTAAGLAAKTMGAGLGDGWLVYGPQADFQSKGVQVSLPIGEIISISVLQKLPTALIKLQQKLFDARLSGSLQLQPGDEGAASAPSNIALTKYWGKQTNELQIPLNSSLSFTLGGFRSFTTVRVVHGTWPWDQWLTLGSNLVKSKHTISWTQAQEESAPDAKLAAFLDLFLSEVFPDVSLSVETYNNFPTACGIASSASGFAALVGALADLLNLSRFFTTSEVEYWCTQWARIGSGSALRSALAFHPNSTSQKQFVAWHFDANILPVCASSAAVKIEAHGVFQELRSCVVVLDDGQKSISSSAGHKSVQTSPLFPFRICQMPQRQHKLISALEAGDFDAVTEIAERDAFEMHALMQTSQPPAIYFGAITSHFVKSFVEFRNATGCKAFWSLDAGPNVHLLHLPNEIENVRSFIQRFADETSAPIQGVKVLWNQCDEGLKIGSGSQSMKDCILQETFVKGAL
jgi:diphosphomevalonate decarboxylase